MVSRQNNNELPPPYSSVIDDEYLQGFPHPPGYTAVSTDDAADETTYSEQSSVADGQDTDRQHGCVRISVDNSLPSYDASNAYSSACPSQTAAAHRSYPSCPPPAYTLATSPPSYQQQQQQQQQQTRRPNDNYISISNRIPAVTQSDDTNSPADGPRCLCMVFWVMGVVFCCLAPCIM